MLYNQHEYSARVTLDEDGFYRWSVEMNKEKKAGQFWFMLKICAVVALVIIGVMAAVSWDSGYFGEMMLTGLGVMAVIILLPAAVWKLMERAEGTTWKRFEMNGDFIKHVGYSVRDSGSISFSHIRKVVINRREDMIWVRGAMIGVQVFVPKEDFRFVLDYIKEKNGGKAAVVYT